VTLGQKKRGGNWVRKVKEAELKHTKGNGEGGAIGVLLTREKRNKGAEV